MTLPIDDYSCSVSSPVTTVTPLAAVSAGGSIAGKRKRSNGPPVYRVERQVVRLKKHIALLERSIADCDREAGELEIEVRKEEDRVEIRDPANIAYSTYAKATAARRDNLMRTAADLRVLATNAEEALSEPDERT
jgi:hypothetical protein